MIRKEVINLLGIIKIDSKFLLVILMLRMSGIPPFLGFFLK